MCRGDGPEIRKESLAGTDKHAPPKAVITDGGTPE